MARSSAQYLSGFQRLYSVESPCGSATRNHIFSAISKCRSLNSDALSGISKLSEIHSSSRSQNLLSKPILGDALLSRIHSTSAPRSLLNLYSKFGVLNSRRLSSGWPIKLPSLASSRTSETTGLMRKELGPRSFSIKRVNSSRFNVDAKKQLVDKPLSAVSSILSRYREAAGLQMEAFWNRNYLIMVGACAVALCIALWKIMFGVASTFVGLSEGMAKYGFLALASAMVAFAAMYLRSRFSINPDKIYRIAMRKLNTSAAILEIMGAPLSGTDVRAYVMSGSGLKLRNFKLRRGGKRCFLIFPIRGSERKGLVSVEVKKKKGQYDMKLLAVDVPMATGPDQRVFLVGNEEEYKVGGGLISELRDPIVKAMAAEKEFEALDAIEEDEEEARELEEIERKKLREEASEPNGRPRGEELAAKRDAS